MAQSTDTITRGELVRAIQATKRRLQERATGEEALDELAREIESPHDCVRIYTLPSGGGPCEHCGEWIDAEVATA